jgi:hypothetical protein
MIRIVRLGPLCQPSVFKWWLMSCYSNKEESDMPETKKTITLYLAGWQKRMIKDCMDLSDFKIESINKLTKLKISILDRKQWVMYKQPPEYMKTGEWNLYLTDEQIHHVTEVFGLKANISALNVSPEMVKSGAFALE